ncbi:MAG: hypothetical protein FWE35_17475 [Streptosporangiales bacterium]|nr:hypothetical protein [Streptosporangiales bacterium]
MSIPRSGAAALTLALITTACLAACGSDPLSSMSAEQIASKAVSDLNSESQFNLSGNVDENGQNLALTLAYKTPSSCSGTIAINGKGNLAVVSIDGTAWIKPDATFWQSYAGAQAQKAISLLGDKYLKSAPNDSNVSTLTSLCTVSSLSSAFTSAGTLTKGDATTVDGQQAIPLKNTHGATVYVSDTSSPQVLEITNSSASNGGKIDFKYGQSTAVAAPAVAETVDGSQFGF